MRHVSFRHVSAFGRRTGSSSSPCFAPRPFLNQLRHYAVESPPLRRTRGRWMGIAVCFGIGASAGVYLAPNPVRLLDEHEFSPYSLVSKERVSSTASIFTFLPEQASSSYEQDDPYEAMWHEAVWSVQAKQPQLQIGRDYTPLPPCSRTLPRQTNSSALRFLIRKEQNGEMSNYLHRLPVGTELALRGPHEHIKIQPGIGKVVFCAGGTGIAPAMQYAYALLSSLEGEDLPKMHIMWANRRREDCEGGSNDTEGSKGWWQRLYASKLSQDSPDEKIGDAGAIVKELNALKELFGGRLTVDYFVDEEQSFIGKSELRASLVSKARTSETDAAIESTNLVLISGSDGFISYLAGPKTTRNGREVQGPVTGLLGDLVIGKRCKVWKL